jgi:hypothetical protein
MTTPREILDILEGLADPELDWQTVPAADLATLKTWAASMSAEPQPVEPTEYERGFVRGMEVGRKRGREMLIDDIRNGEQPAELTEPLRTMTTTADSLAKHVGTADLGEPQVSNWYRLYRCVVDHEVYETPITGVIVVASSPEEANEVAKEYCWHPVYVIEEIPGIVCDPPTRVIHEWSE